MVTSSSATMSGLAEGRYLVTPGREISNALVVLKGKAS